MDSISGGNPTNNPRLDLLHSTGNNQQLAGAAGSYGPAAFAKSAPTPRPKPQPSEAPASAASYVKAAQPDHSKEPVAPPALPPEPRDAPEPNMSVPSEPKPTRGGPVLIGVAVVLVVGAVIAGVWWWLSHRHAAPVATKPTPSATAPGTPTDLNQIDSSGATLSQGVTTKKTQITFQFNDSTTATSGSFTPEVELEPTGTSFTGKPTATGKAVAANGSMQFSVDSPTLKDAAYHWQARVSENGKSSGWAIFAGDSSATAFTVDTTAPGAPTVSSIGGVTIANPTTVTSNRPAIVGKTDPNATISVAVTPDSQSFTTTADASGNWTLTPNADIPNGQHQLSITSTDGAGNTGAATTVALTINPATAAATAPVSGATGKSSTATSSSSSASSSTATAKPSTSLAQTGDNTTLISRISLAIMVIAAAGIAWVRRRYVTF